MSHILSIMHFDIDDLLDREPFLADDFWRPYEHFCAGPELSLQSDDSLVLVS